MRKILFAMILAVLLAAGLYSMGPRVEVDTQIRFQEASLSEDLDAWLAGQEAKFGDIREGLAKEIVWADPDSKAKTPLSIIYLHGFTASKGEVRPLPDRVAEAFGANLFYTRFAGHGRSSSAMAEATVNAWVNDLAEALTIGRRIGEKVIVIATSTGGSIAAWGAADAELMRSVAGLVLISPNFGVPDKGMPLLLLPWGEKLAQIVLGDELGTEPPTELQRHLWTWRYPVKALLPLSAMMALARSTDFEKITVPALFILSDQDQVVLPQETREIAKRWGTDARIQTVDDSSDPAQHVIAGDARSPETTQKIAEEIIRWIQEM